MLTVHAADLLLSGDGRAPVPGGAVVVRGGEIAAVGPYEEVAAAHPGARLRRWPGVLTPGLVNPYGPELLERAYHPDPREAGELGTEPLTGEALAALEMPESRWGASARRGVQRLLAHGVVAVAGDLRRPAVVDAVTRVGLGREPRSDDPPGPPSLDPLADGRPLGEAIVAPLGPVGAAATFAVFDAPDEDALLTHGAGTCVATVIGGRLLHRTR
ncbi:MULTISPECIES: imidazolonepropionase-like domain-containing protein [Streptomyces]|uniref:imidazolonepropionase-like domain-containing protein n=1 Tax=Streptomyces TaxID=1883 RepID=UPI0013170088|nr:MULTISPECIES: hypothetical protein [Streptomyces]QGZ50331.1 hypothetical protein GPZ77_19940 [Streptomyces sp. QHH-9511]GGT87683.1 hypothetical protein GCM10010272_35570 [Streptomyces lateritius]